MKISIIGFNIFGIGGTSRSNLNMIYEFSKDNNNEITYYNFADFSKIDILELVQRESFMRGIKYENLNDIFNIPFDESDTSLYFITRESFFVAECYSENILEQVDKFSRNSSQSDTKSILTNTNIRRYF